MGRAAEELARGCLVGAGLEIVAANARVRYAEIGIAGELDVVALDGSTLVFVEVKAGRSDSAYGPVRPALAVDRRKQLRLRRLARAWLATADPPRFRAIRFDVVGVTYAPGRPPDLEWIRDAF
jgi:putative endonuclease